MTLVFGLARYLLLLLLLLQFINQQVSSDRFIMSLYVTCVLFAADLYHPDL